MESIVGSVEIVGIIRLPEDIATAPLATWKVCGVTSGKAGVALWKEFGDLEAQICSLLLDSFV